MVLKKKINKLRLINFVKVLGLSKVSEIHILNGILSPNKGNLKTDDFITIDAKDCIVSPGFVDVQVNGYKKCNFWKISPTLFSEIDNLRLELASHGIVAFCPTVITGPQEKILQSINHINLYLEQASSDVGARILGIHLEGIFITRYGVHDSRYVQKELSVKNVEPFLKDNVILFTLAPELDQTGEAIKFLQRNNVLVSIGHSNASYKWGEIAIKKYGLRTVTHMFNCLKGVAGFSHRGNDKSDLNLLKSKLNDQKNINPDEDGIMLALLKDKNVLCMVISDGIHVNRDAMGLLRSYKDNDHFALVSDIVSTNFYNSVKETGNLGGGQTTLDKCVLNLVDWKVSNLEDSLIFASKPISSQLKIAKELGLGEITFGKEVNIVLWDIRKNAVKGTIIGENVFLNYED